MLSNQTILLNDFCLQWQYYKHAILQAVERVGNSGWLILGQEVKHFEKNLADYWGLPYAVGCGNGLDAIEIGLRCLGLRKGAKVLTTPLSAFATTLAIIRAGGVPVFADTDDNGLIDLAHCSRLLTENPDIRYFVPVHLYGQALAYSTLLQLKKTFNLCIVEDCAQAIGAQSEGKPVGSVGQIATTSFYPTKNLGAMGDGGALLMQDSQLYQTALCLRDYGQSEKYVHQVLGLNSRLDELQAAILNDAFLPNLKNFTQRRQEIADFYYKNICHANLSLPKIPAHALPVWHLFPVMVKNSQYRQSFEQHLEKAQIKTARHYPVLIPDQMALKNNDNQIQSALFIHAQYIADHEVSLPIHALMTPEQVSRVVKACNDWVMNP